MMTGRAHDVDGVRLAVLERGTGAPVLFEHGLCGDALQPAEVFPLQAFRCLTVECRGHGGSGAGDPQHFRIATFCDDIARYLDRRRLGPLTIGGISMGAAIALRLAVVRPDLVKALILARPAWTTEAAPENMRPYALIGDLLATFPAAEARRRFELSATAREFAQRAPANLASLRSFFAREPQTTTAALLSRISADGPGVSRAQVRALDVPALVIAHDRDLVHTLDVANELAALIPGARLAVISAKADDNARYVEDFRAALRAFLAELTA
jgi:pimeloyl-ACP methyl ester carboxylesterase